MAWLEIYKTYTWVLCPFGAQSPFFKCRYRILNMRFLLDSTWRPLLAWLAPLSLLSSSLPSAYAAAPDNSTRKSGTVLALDGSCLPGCSAGSTVHAPPYWRSEAIWMGTGHGPSSGKRSRLSAASVVQLVSALHSLGACPLTFAYLIVFTTLFGSVGCWSTARCKKRRLTGSKYARMLPEQGHIVNSPHPVTAGLRSPIKYRTRRSSTTRKHSSTTSSAHKTPPATSGLVRSTPRSRSSSGRGT